MTSRSRAEISPQSKASASSSTAIRSANTTIQYPGPQGTNFSKASISNTSVEDFARPSAITRTYNIWVKNATNVQGNNEILKNLRGYGLSLDDIMCSQLGSGLTDVNFFTTNLTGAQALDIGNLKEASNEALNLVSMEPLTLIQMVSTVTLRGHGVTATEDVIYREVSNFTTVDAIDKRDTDLDQRPEMVYLSQPRMAQGGGVPLEQLGGQ